MFLSKASEYGIKSMIFIANQSLINKRSNVNEIAEAIGSPVSYTAKILQILGRNNLIQSVRGAYGGYEIEKRNVKEINLLDIVIAIDGDAILNACVLGLSHCSSDNPCPIHEKYAKLREQIIMAFRHADLKELSQKLDSKFITLKN